MSLSRTTQSASGPRDVGTGRCGRATLCVAGTATRIGRSPDNDIVLADAKVSRHHAVIADDGRTILITDLGSANGVRVRRARIDPSAELHNGDGIRIGDEEFTLDTGADPGFR